MSAGHIRRRSPGSWELKLELPRDPVTGKRRSRTVTIRGTRRDAERELRRLLTQLDQGQYVDPGKLTISEWLERWLAETRHTVSLKTHERYTEIVDRHLVPAFGSIPLAKLTAASIQHYYSTALAGGRLDGRGGLSAQTVKHHARVLGGALKRARRLRLTAFNPAEDATAPKVERKEMVLPNADEMAKLFAALRSSRIYCAAALAFATGTRRGEVLALRWSDIDLEAGELQVTRSVEQTKGRLRYKAPKTVKGRRQVALSAAAVELLREHRVSQLEERLALGLGRDTEDLVFTKLDGSLINPAVFSAEFCRVARLAGVKIGFHGLRHAHLTALLRAGVHPLIASRRAGHSTVGITLDLYSHVTADMQADAAQRIDSTLRQTFGGNPVAKRP